MGRKQIYSSDDPKKRQAQATQSYKIKNNIKRVAIDMPEETIINIKEFAYSHGITMVQLFSDAIDYYMQNYYDINHN